MQYIQSINLDNAKLDRIYGAGWSHEDDCDGDCYYDGGCDQTYVIAEDDWTHGFTDYNYFARLDNVEINYHYDEGKKYGSFLNIKFIQEEIHIEYFYCKDYECWDGYYNGVYMLYIPVDEPVVCYNYFKKGEIKPFHDPFYGYDNDGWMNGWMDDWNDTSEIKWVDRPAESIRILHKLIEDLETKADTMMSRKAATSIDQPRTNALTLHGLYKMFDSMCKLGASVVPELIVQSCCVICYPTIKMKDLKYPDNTSGSLCDIEGYDASDTCVLAVDVKYNLTITDGMLRTFDKKTKGIRCRYMLTTKSNTKCRVSEDDVVTNSVADFCVTELMRVRHDQPSVVADMHAEVRKSVLATSDLSMGLKQECIDVLDA